MALRADASRAADRRKKAFMKGIDADDARRKREDNIIELRKNKRDENLQKKRMVFATGGVEDSSRSLEDSNRNTQKVSLRRQSPAATRAKVEICLGCNGTQVPPLCPQLDNLPSMVQGVYSEDVQQQLEATMQFRKLLSIGALLRSSRSEASLKASIFSLPGIPCRAESSNRGGHQSRGHPTICSISTALRPSAAPGTHSLSSA